MMISITISFIVSLSILALIAVYFMTLRRGRRRVAKSWLTVYEIFLKRADKIPRLVELIRREMPKHSDILEKLIHARSETQNMSLPSLEKSVCEHRLTDALNDVISWISATHPLSSEHAISRVIRELDTWDSPLNPSVTHYNNALTNCTYFRLGKALRGYQKFQY